MNDAQSQQPVIKADKRTRTFFILAWIVCVCVGVVLTKWGLPWGQGQLERTEPATALVVVQIVIGSVFLIAVPSGVYLFLFGRRVVACRQMPPPGTKVIVDTKVLVGAKAVARGRLMMALALLSIVTGLAGGLYLPYMIGKEFGEILRQPAPQTSQAK